PRGLDLTGEAGAPPRSEPPFLRNWKERARYFSSCADSRGRGGGGDGRAPLKCVANSAAKAKSGGGSRHREDGMPTQQGSLELLQSAVAQELLLSKIPARLAYSATDGTPRVVPIWFHWNGSELVMATPPKAPKLKALARNPKIALTIDDNQFPHKVLLIRGTARLQPVDGVVPEYAAAAERYFGPEQGQAWVRQLRGMLPGMVKVTITPEWVGVLDFQTRFPSALSA